ncbi:hypothetical protein HDE_09997 [Halotydeus destructor]|nr:hypothetical protein HDE_09997 [Halotydeus destructor]
MINLDDLASNSDSATSMISVDGHYETETDHLSHQKDAHGKLAADRLGPCGPQENGASSPKKTRVDVSYDNQMKNQMTEHDQVAYQETYAYLPVHERGSSVYPPNYGYGYNDLEGYDNVAYHVQPVTGMDYGHVVHNSGTTSDSLSTGSGRSDSGLSLDYSPRMNGFYGYPSSNHSSSSSPQDSQGNREKTGHDGNSLTTLTSANCISRNTESGGVIRVERRRVRYLKTVDFLKSSNLFEVTMKTADLLKKNYALQKELEKLKNEVSHFLSSFSSA